MSDAAPGAVEPQVFALHDHILDGAIYVDAFHPPPRPLATGNIGNAEEEDALRTMESVDHDSECSPAHAVRLADWTWLATTSRSSTTVYLSPRPEPSAAPSPVEQQPIYTGGWKRSVELEDQAEGRQKRTKRPDGTLLFLLDFENCLMGLQIRDVRRCCMSLRLRRQALLHGRKNAR